MSDASAFISRWRAASASERSNSQLFLSELADLLQVERPHNNFDHGYAFEFTVTEHHHDGGSSERRIDLQDETIRERLRLVWTDPLSLDPARKSAEVTRDIAAYLGELAKSYESAGHPPQVVADFLSRCLFCMFAEDVGLLPKDSFKNLLEQVNDDGSGFQELLGQLFREMNTGTGDKLSLVLRKKLLQFNGGLFADDTVLPVNKHQLILLRAASGLNWRNVEPAIFGTSETLPADGNPSAPPMHARGLAVQKG